MSRLTRRYEDTAHDIGIVSNDEARLYGLAAETLGLLQDMEPVLPVEPGATLPKLKLTVFGSDAQMRAFNERYQALLESRS